jgi:hypothetical protein
MNSQPRAPSHYHPTAADLANVEDHVRRRLSGRVRDFRLSFEGEGLVLDGQASTYYAKQLAQQAVLEAARWPIRANRIKVA